MDRSRAPRDISFRHLLKGELEAFLNDVHMTCEPTASALAELVVTLARCREEGASLFPTVFIGDDRAALMELVGARDYVPLGDGDRSADTMRQAIKLCAPLGRGGWSIYVGREPPGFHYGVFRTDNFVLEETSLERLRAANVKNVRAFGVVQLGEDVLELRGSGGIARYVYLSGARPGVVAPSFLTRQLVATIARDAAESVQPKLSVFYRRVLIQAARDDHGNLIAVLDSQSDAASLFTDGALLDRPIDVASAVAAHDRDPNESTREAVQALANLMWGMLSADGVTVLRSDGAIVGFNAFIEHHHSQNESRRVVGGARRRTFDALCGAVGRELAAAFYQSQDGAAELRTPDAMLSRA